MRGFDAGVSRHSGLCARPQSTAAAEAGIRGLKFLSGVADTLIVAQGSRHRTKKWVTSEGGVHVGQVDTHAGSTVSMQSIEQEIRQFITDNFLFGEEADLANDDSLLDHGIIDSTGVLELVAFLEDKYEIQIPDRELVPTNLDTVNRMVQFVNRKVRA